MSERGSNDVAAMKITEVAMASAFGERVEDACAAARAGLSRASEIKDYEVLDQASSSMVPVVAHVAHSVTDGFAGFGRLARLGFAAVQDLITRGGLGEDALARTAIVVNLPSGYHQNVALLHELLLLEDEGADLSTDEVPGPCAAVHTAQETCRERLFDVILPQCALDHVPRRELLFDDDAGFASALQVARSLLESESIDRCMVGGVDSLLDEACLDSLSALGLLKQPSNPAGMMPGEAAAFVLLELGKPSGRDEISVKSQTVAVGPHQFGKDAATGEGLREVLVGVHGALGPGQTVLMIGNANGTQHRALEVGHALVVLPEELQSAPRWDAPESFGDTGAANGFIAMCIAHQAFARGYAPAKTAVVYAMSPTGRRGAALLAPA